jgi:hypothetical protein
MRIELHCDSKYSSDNWLEPEEVIEQAMKAPWFKHHRDNAQLKAFVHGATSHDLPQGRDS